MKPLVSVVMPVFNGGRFIEEALNSLYRQSFEDFEIVLIDDGSQDNTRELIHKHAHLDSRVRIVLQQHAGIVSALNRGCSIATGYYIARLDADDVAKPWRFQRQVAFLNQHRDVVLVGGGIECIDDIGKVLFKMNWPTLNDGLEDYMQIDCHISHTTVMFRKRVFEEIGGYRELFPDAEDYDLFMRLGDRYKIDNLPEIIGQYRIHQRQISAENAMQQVLSGISIRLATRARRRGHTEINCAPQNCSTRDYLMSQGLTSTRIDQLVGYHLSSRSMYASGWKWRRLPFCEILNSSQ
jgi:glycosyltransferase involved in cell wall biosynthesis